MVALYLESQLHFPDRRLSLLAFPFLCAGGFAAWTAIFCISVWSQISPDVVRICTSSLTAEGFRDVTPEKVHTVDWGRVSAVREHDGDIHLWWGFDKGCFIPRTAFSDGEEATRFHQAAVILWRSRGTVWPEVFPPLARPSSAGGSVPCPLPRSATDDNPYAPPMASLGQAPGVLTASFGAMAASLALVFLFGCLCSGLFWWLG
jgi:hypothetical protein